MKHSRNKAPRTKAQNDKKPESARLLSGRLTASVKTNAGKISEVLAVNHDALRLKREMSAFVLQNILRVPNDAYGLAKEYTQFESRYLNAWERQKLMEDVVGAYARTLSNLLARSRFLVQAGWTFETYKRAVVRNGRTLGRKGEVKPGTFRLSAAKSTMARAAEILVQCDLSSLDLSKFNKTNQALLTRIASDTAKWSRLLALVRTRQDRLIFKRIKLHEFTTGTHRRSPVESCSCIVHDASNGAFQWFYRMRIGTHKQRRFVHLPLAFNNRYLAPGDLRLDAAHLLQVKRGGQINILLTREASVPVFKEPGEILGLDVNTKHNLFATSRNEAYDYDRTHLDKVVDALNRLDEIGTRNFTYKDRAVLAKNVRRTESVIKRSIHDMLNAFETQSVTDIVMEDLSRFKGSLSSRHEDFDVKYTRLLRLLRLGSLKAWVAEQANKRGIRVHLTQAAYSSQQCPKCAYISRGNRTTQEQFCCEACGFEHPADFVAGMNLERRLRADVLSKKLHEFDPFGQARPKMMPGAELKGILTSEAWGVIDLQTHRFEQYRPPLRGRHLEETPPIAANAV